MSNGPAPIAPEQLHPSLWLASQLARAQGHCIDSGYPALSAQLPGGGWPTGALIEILVPQPGVGEIRLVQPALASVSGSIVMVQPPHDPQAVGLASLGIDPSRIVWIRKTSKSADALWAAEQVLRSGCCGALMLWQSNVRSDALRRLHLAAQAAETLFFFMRPLAMARDPSPAPLRVAVRPAPDGIDVEFVKRKGPQREVPLFLPLVPSMIQRLPQRGINRGKPMHVREDLAPSRRDSSLVTP